MSSPLEFYKFVHNVPAFWQVIQIENTKVNIYYKFWYLVCFANGFSKCFTDKEVLQ